MEHQLLKRVLRWAERVVGLAFVGYVGWYIYLRWTEVSGSALRFSWGPFLLSIVALLVFYVLYSMGWQATLRAVQPSVRTFSTLQLHRVFFVAFITRYVPGGKVVTLGSRVELFKRLGGTRTLAVESLFYEQLYLVLGALLLGVVSLTAKPVPGFLTFISGVRGWVGAASILLLVVIFLVADRPLASAPKWLGLGFVTRRWIRVPVSRKVGIFAWFLIVNVAQGLAVYLMLRSVYPQVAFDALWVLVVGAAYLVGRVVGQVVAVVPGGIGIREGAFTFLLSAFLPVQPVLLTAGVFRLISVVIESCLAGGLVLAGRIWRTPDEKDGDKAGSPLSSPAAELEGAWDPGEEGR